MNQLFKIQIYTFLALGLLALALLAIIFIVVFNKNQKETSQSNNENNTNIEIFDKVQLDYVITHYNPFIKCFEMFGKNGKSYLQNSSSNAFKPSSSNSFYKALSNISSQVHFDINQSSTTQSGYDCTTIQNFEIMTKNIINVFDNLIKTSPEFKNEVDLLRKAFKIESVDNIKNWISDINTLDNLIYKTQNFINKQGNSSLNPKILLGKFKGRAIRTIVFSTFDTTFVQEFKFSEQKYNLTYALLTNKNGIKSTLYTSDSNNSFFRVGENGATQLKNISEFTDNLKDSCIITYIYSSP